MNIETLATLMCQSKPQIALPAKNAGFVYSIPQGFVLPISMIDDTTVSCIMCQEMTTDYKHLFRFACRPEFGHVYVPVKSFIKRVGVIWMPTVNQALYEMAVNGRFVSEATEATAEEVFSLKDVFLKQIREKFETPDTYYDVRAYAHARAPAEPGEFWKGAAKPSETLADIFKQHMV